uniref:Uncharacterized protein n=1 Tax=Panagrellus redivivus TaxID=6233 RepID=A0A7E4VKE5_PANRE
MPWSLHILIVLLIYSILYIITETVAKNIASIDDFYCYNDYTIADKPFDYLVRNRRIFEQSCGCRTDWKQTFCENLDRYLKLDVRSAPKVCICRRIDDTDKSCDQFMTRCFWEKNSHEKSCKCCFNQPDDHCYQIDCKNLEPDFGRSLNKSCICHDQSVYPVRVCRNSDISPRNRKPGSSNIPIPPNFYYNVANDNNMSEKRAVLATDNDSFIDSTWAILQNNKLILVFVVILLIGLLGAICFGCGVLCFGRVHSTRTQRAKRERRSVQEKRLLEIAQNDDVDRYLP